jgi:hypothetical protein
MYTPWLRTKEKEKLAQILLIWSKRVNYRYSSKRAGGSPSEFKEPSGVAFDKDKGVVSPGDNISQCLAGLWTVPEEKKGQWVTHPRRVYWTRACAQLGSTNLSMSNGALICENDSLYGDMFTVGQKRSTLCQGFPHESLPN